MGTDSKAIIHFNEVRFFTDLPTVLCKETSHSTGQEFSVFKIHRRVHKSLPPGSVLSQYPFSLPIQYFSQYYHAIFAKVWR
jgi:hypothetical protein